MPESPDPPPLALGDVVLPSIDALPEGDPQDIPVVIDIPLSEKESANARKRKKYAAKTPAKKTNSKVQRTIQKGNKKNRSQ